jgi:hypothetical protein
MSDLALTPDPGHDRGGLNIFQRILQEIGSGPKPAIVHLRSIHRPNGPNPWIYRLGLLDRATMEIYHSKGSPQTSRPVTLYPEHVDRFDYNRAAGVLSIWTN